MKYYVNFGQKNNMYMHQIAAGFTMLMAEKKYDVIFSEKASLVDEFYHSAIIEVCVKNKRIIYDLSDGYNNYPSFSALDRMLDNVDVYFKATIKRSFHNGFRNASKIKEIPPRYNVTCRNSWVNTVDIKEIFGKNGKTELRRIYDRLPCSKHWIGLYYDKAYEMEPMINDDPMVFFYTRLWDPAIASSKSSQNVDLDGGDVQSRIEQKKEEYSEITKLRAGLVRALKNEFGIRFLGGVAADNFSQKYCPDLLGSDMSSRKKYTELLHKADICINTQGTHKCWNFSFGEEIAASKAIITEQPFYEVPAHMAVGTNFLTYTSIDECIQQANLLYKNKEALIRMMNANRSYYLSYLRPDRYVENSILEALGE